MYEGLLDQIKLLVFPVVILPGETVFQYLRASGLGIVAMNGGGWRLVFIPVARDKIWELFVSLPRLAIVRYCHPLVRPGNLLSSQRPQF